MNATASPVPSSQRWKVAVARARPILFVTAGLLVLWPLLDGVGPLDLPARPGWAFPAVLVSALLAMFVPVLAVDAPPTLLADVPLRGRWMAMNSSATKVPSHVTLAYGQSHAVDLVLDPDDGSRPEFGGGSPFPAPDDYPAFGQPLTSPVDGTVVAASDWRRDHRGRATTLAVAYMFVEGMLREVGGAGFVIGNHVTIRRDDGLHVLFAHVRRRSIEVARGDRVHVGDRLAAVGNSGNSSEPHLHLQLMDHARPSLAAGLPFGFDDVEVDGDHVAGIPANGDHLLA